MEEIKRKCKLTELQLELSDIQRSLQSISISADQIQETLDELDAIVEKPVIRKRHRLPPKGPKKKLKTGPLFRSVSETDLDKLVKAEADAELQ